MKKIIRLYNHEEIIRLHYENEGIVQANSCQYNGSMESTP